MEVYVVLYATCYIKGVYTDYESVVKLCESDSQYRYETVILQTTTES